MSRNFYTTNSEKALRNYALGLVIWTAFSMAVSYAIFLYNPQFFYFRAWEYCNEVLYPNPERPQVWDGFEKGDMSRPYFFRFQESYHTRVTFDHDGFRIAPYKSDNYEALVYGDSQAFGSGVSDDETFSWKLALKLKVPIFNATKVTNPKNLLNKPGLQKTRLIINVVQNAAVSIQDYFPEDQTIEDYHPLRTNVAPVSIRRFYLPYLPMSRMEAAIKDILLKLLVPESPNDYICGARYRILFSEDDLNRQAVMISKYSGRLTELGYTYVLVLVPHRCLLYSESTDEFSKQFFPRLIKSLEKSGVYVVDLQEAFLKNKDKGLFFNNDTHWNARGTEIAADEVAAYLKKKGLVEGIKTVEK